MIRGAKIRRWVAMAAAALLTGGEVRAEDGTDPYAPVRSGSWQVWAVQIVVDGRILFNNAVVNGLCVLDQRWPLHTWPTEPASPHPQPLAQQFEGALSASSGSALPPLRGSWFVYHVAWVDKPAGTPSQTARDQRSLLVPFPLDGAGAPERADLLRMWIFDDCTSAVLTEEEFMSTMRSLSGRQRRVLTSVLLEWVMWALPPTRRIPPIELDPPGPLDYDAMRDHADQCRRSPAACQALFQDFKRASEK